MLFLVLVLVVVAFGLLVTALATTAMLWAWVSVGASALAAIALMADWRRRRRRANAAPPPFTASPIITEQAPIYPRDDPDQTAEPAEEDTDAADLLTVTELDGEVRVVDERPRYHLADCRWLADRPTLGLPIREARELGFTPCSVCSPDRTLAAAHRTASTQ
jgi:hypothetical protein